MTHGDWEVIDAAIDLLRAYRDVPGVDVDLVDDVMSELGRILPQPRAAPPVVEPVTVEVTRTKIMNALGCFDEPARLGQILIVTGGGDPETVRGHLRMLVNSRRVVEHNNNGQLAWSVADWEGM